MTDWGQAMGIAGFGFLTVFVVLSILASVLWLVCSAIAKSVSKQSKEQQVKEKGT